MLLVILGAGASYDSASPSLEAVNRVWQPPVTDELFSRSQYRPLLNRYWAVRGLAEAMVARRAHPTYGKLFSLEDELLTVTRDATTEPSRARELVGLRFYLQSLLRSCSEDWVEGLGGMTVHAWLVREIELWRRANQADQAVAYATFNYDTILDVALESQFGWQPTADLKSYVTDPRFVLLKLHGSYNWVVRTNLGAVGGLPDAIREHIIDHGASVKETGQFRLLQRSGRGFNIDDVVDSIAGGTALCAMPAIAIPVTGKRTFECPAEHLAVLDQVLSKVDQVLALGWRGQDKHFVDRLTSLKPEVRFTIVSRSGASAVAIKDRLATAGVTADFQPVAVDGLGMFRQSELRSILS